MHDLATFLKERGFPVSLPCDGVVHRFEIDRPGKFDGFFVGHKTQVAGKSATTAFFGDWRKRKEDWHSFQAMEGPSPTPEELVQMERELERHKARVAEERRAHAETVAKECADLWEKRYTVRGSSPYFQKKGLGEALFGCRLEPTEKWGVQTLVPLQDVHGKLWTLQRIVPDGSKFFTPGGRKKGCFHALSPLPEDPNYDGKLGITEGVATAASVQVVSSFPILAAMDTGNLAPVARALRNKYPKAELTFFADNDQWKGGDNPGRDAAHAAAKEAGGTSIVLWPRFDGMDVTSLPTDWNDLHVLAGIDALRGQIEEGLRPPLLPAPVVDAGCGEDDCLDLEPLEWHAPKKPGSPPRPPSHQELVDALMAHYEGRMLKREEDLFEWVGTHWQHLQSPHLDRLKRQFQQLVGKGATAAQLDAMLELFRICLPPAPADIFSPKYGCANFTNGTLHVERGEDYHWKKRFTPHAREDYLLHVIPLEYRPERGETNPAFIEMLQRVTEGDPDQKEKLQALQEMYGAMICALQPHLFMLYGPAGSGKSTVMLPAMRLVHQDNLCHVEPYEFHGFLMESMIGKKVNLVTDISTTRPIEDAHVKKIEDRVAMRMDRKFKTPINAPLPPIHIFGGNAIPPTLEGVSQAHDRRWTFIELKSHQTVKGKYLHDYGHWVYEQSPQGVLNFALEGLDRLIANGGHYTTPASGQEAMTEWLRSADPIESFLHDARCGDLEPSCQLIEGPNEKIEPQTLWKIFANWKREGEIVSRGGRNEFYKRIAQKGFPKTKVKGVYYFLGIAQRTGEESKF